MRTANAPPTDDQKLAPEIDPPEVPQTGDILVADDSPSNLLAIEAALANLGGELVKVSSGAEALRALLDRRFALILLDVQMPNLDGFETARLIRARKLTHHIPIIFITAYGRDDDQVLRGYELGAVDFLFKPVVPEVLRAKASVFVALQCHAAEISRQAELLRQHERREQERRFLEEKRRWEAVILRQRVEELAEADRRKDEFLAILGHELRNPMTPILHGLTVLSSSNNPAVVERTRGAIDRQVRHLVRLVDDLLDVSRITMGRIELQRETLHVVAILERAIAMSRPLIEEKRHTLSVEIEDGKQMVHGDGVRLTQVVSNLLNNAARYTQDGGTIRLVCHRDDGKIVIRVIDNGQGIETGLQSSVFDLFVQHSPGGGGLGIGLTLVARLVKMHGGSVTVHSEGAGRGSEFKVTLPLSDVPAAANVSPVVVETTTEQSRLRIVVAEDNADIRNTLRDLLEHWGHRVQTAENGRLGADLVIRERPDVALVDIGMPELDGYGVAERVRHALGPGRVRMIAMTGFGQREARDRALDAGFDTHLVKPVDAESLRALLTATAVDAPHREWARNSRG